MSVILCTYNMKWKCWKTFVSLGRPARPRLDHGARKGKGDDYQEVDVNGKRLSHKNTRRSLQKLVSLGYKKKQTKWPIELWTLKQEMDGNGNWWRPCKHERKVLIGLEHTVHSLEGTSGVLCCLQHQFLSLICRKNSKFLVLYICFYKCLCLWPGRPQDKSKKGITGTICHRVT